MRKLLSILFFIFVTQVSYGQTFTQTFVDRCTGEVQVVTANFQTGSAVVSFYNKVKLFTYQQYVNGEMHEWLMTTYAWWQALSPCSAAQTQATNAQNAANNATSSATNATNTTSTNTNTSSTSTNNTSSGSSSSSGSSGSSSGGDSGSGSSGGSEGGGSSEGSGEGSGGSSEGSGEGGGEGSGEGEGEGSGEGSGEGEGEGEGSGESEEKKEESKEEEKKEEESKEEEKEEEKKEEESEDEESKDGDGEDEEEDDKKEKKMLPIQLKADMMAQQALTLDYNAVLNIGASMSSIFGDRSYGANLMIYDNLKQANLSLNTSLVTMNDNYEVKWVDGVNLSYMRNYKMNAISASASRMKPMGKWGTVGVGINYSYMMGKDQLGEKLPQSYMLGWNVL